FASAPDANEHGSLANGGLVTEAISVGDVDSYTFTGEADHYVMLHAVDTDDTAFRPRIWLYAPDGSYLTYGQGTQVAEINSFRLPQSGTYTVLVEDWSSGGAATGDYELHFASAPDANEHGSLANGGLVTETISVGDVDSYTLSVEAGQFVTIHAVDIDDTAFRPRIWLYAPDGSYLTYGQGTQVGKILNFQVPQTGTYTVLVEDWSSGGAATGNYELHFASAPDANEHGALIQGVAKTETITMGDLDSYTFEASAGSLVDLSLKDVNDTALRPIFYLYGPTGDYLTYRTGNEEAVLEGYQVGTTGTHTVVISDSSSGGASTGDYQILLGLEGGTSNSAPVAEAGAPISVAKGEVVDLDGSGSVDTDGAPQPLTYAWEIAVVPEGSQITTNDLSSTDQATTSFMPDVGGVYVASLSVSDGELEDTDTVTITVENQAPVASVGSDQQVLVGQTVTLDGSGSSDGDMDPLDYSWTLESAPSGSSVTDLTNADTPVASFTPDVAGLYGVSLVVSDGEAASQPASITITASETNVGPTAVIDAPASVYLGDVVPLNGGDSFDPDAGPDSLTFEWTLQSVPADSDLTAVDIAGRLTQAAFFTPDAAGSYVVQLTVSDGDAIGSTTAEIQVGISNQAPIADAGSDQSAIVGDTVSLDGSGSSDPDNGPLGLTYQWSFVFIPAGSALVQGDIMLSNSELASFMPDVPGSYVLELEVFDGEMSATDSVTITVEGEAGPMACDMNGDGKVDISDIYAIMSLARTAATGPDDPADWNDDGVINVLDARGCVLQCDVPGCGS
ncbi:PKD domain-containing protein, partial [Marinobacter halophilus]|uniref:PKD domain-containing protein n=1 Tax=Marinobacter halophilus TaxID=1323740 RepID=UPI0022311C2F